MHLLQLSNGTQLLTSSKCAQGKRLLKCFAVFPMPQCPAEQHQQEPALYRHVAQQFLTHPCADQPFCFRALSGGTEAIAAAATKWVLCVESKFAWTAPVTVDTFHIYLKKNEVLQSLNGDDLREINLKMNDRKALKKKSHTKKKRMLEH